MLCARSATLPGKDRALLLSFHASQPIAQMSYVNRSQPDNRAIFTSQSSFVLKRMIDFATTFLYAIDILCKLALQSELARVRKRDTRWPGSQECPFSFLLSDTPTGSRYITVLRPSYYHFGTSNTGSAAPAGTSYRTNVAKWQLSQ